MKVQCVIREWKADDSPISFETFLFTMFYYIKPNQLSQRLPAIIANWVGILKQCKPGVLESKHIVCAITLMRALESCN